MNNDLIILITGGACGIGFATAKYFGLKGWNVVFNDKDHKQGTKACETLLSMNIKAEFFPCNVANEDEVNQMFAEVTQRYGYLDVLVNNAGELGGRHPFEGMPTTFWQNVMDQNLTGAFYCTRASIPLLKQRQQGSIINLTSIAAYNGGGPGAGVYAISKAGMLTLTKALAKELIPFNIRVNAVSPGTIDTDFHKNTPRELLESWRLSIPVKKLGLPEQVASVIYFLVSEEASYLVGEVIQINGGQMML